MSCKKTKLYNPYSEQPMEVHSCLSNEVQWLWDKGIVVIDCDCGENEDLGYIVVDKDSIDHMVILGYERYVYKDCERYDTFIPKSYGHIHNSYFI